MFSQILVIVLFLWQAPLIAMDNQEEIPAEPVLVGMQTFKKDNQNYLAINFKNHPHWHTYWQNPGDSGLSIKVKFTVNNKPLELEALQWPSPTRFTEGENLWTYGLINEYSLFYRLPEELTSTWTNRPFKANLTWLVCKHICIPGKKELNSLTTDSGVNETGVTFSHDQLQKLLMLLPKKAQWPKELDIVLKKDPTTDGLVLFYNFSSATKHLKINDINFLTPLRVSPLDFRHESLALDSKGILYGKTPISWDGEYEEPPMQLPKDGLFEKPITMTFHLFHPERQEAQIIEKTFTRFDLNGTEELNQFFSLLSKVDLKKGADLPQKSTSSDPFPLPAPQKNGLLYFLALAFIGGLILNIMPCVLPVISLKLFHLLSIREKNKSLILRHNLLYSFGVLASFLVMAIVVIVIKATGQGIGWGFQMQSPGFILAMILIIYVLGLNMLGLFEFHTPGGNKIGAIKLGEGPFADFFNGVLATLLATPCSAPFLGTALTFAFTSPPLEITLTFLAIGLGLASPFLLTGFFPALIKFLPKPGQWMITLKKALGIILLITLLWLFDILFALTENQMVCLALGVGLILLGITLIFRRKVSNKLAKNVLLIFPTVLFIYAYQLIPEQLPQASNRYLEEKQSKGLPWEKWSAEKMAYYQQKQEWVFIDFTAKWCVTCKINDKTVLETKSFKTFIEKNNLKLLLGDYTNGDPLIEKFLQGHGLVGVPAYFIQRPNGQLINLGTMINIQRLEKIVLD